MHGSLSLADCGLDNASRVFRHWRYPLTLVGAACLSAMACIGAARPIAPASTSAPVVMSALQPRAASVMDNWESLAGALATASTIQQVQIDSAAVVVRLSPEDLRRHIGRVRASFPGASLQAERDLSRDDVTLVIRQTSSGR
jgi:hypothetical protein